MIQPKTNTVASLMSAVFYSCVLYLFVQDEERFQSTTMFSLLSVPKLDLAFVCTGHHGIREELKDMHTTRN
jgi:hypothetical protein